MSELLKIRKKSLIFLILKHFSWWTIHATVYIEEAFESRYDHRETRRIFEDMMQLWVKIKETVLNSGLVFQENRDMESARSVLELLASRFDEIEEWEENELFSFIDWDQINQKVDYVEKEARDALAEITAFEKNNKQMIRSLNTIHGLMESTKTANLEKVKKLELFEKVKKISKEAEKVDCPHRAWKLNKGCP